MNNILANIREFFRKNSPILFALLGVVIFIASFRSSLGTTSLSQQSEDLQTTLQQRQKMLEEYAYDLLSQPIDAWPQFKEFPFDMVLYRYNSDTLISWIHEFPIDNDDLSWDASHQSYKIHYVDWQNEFTRPLSHINGAEQYINIGSRWYVARLYSKGSQKVIAALLVKTDPSVAQATGAPEINPRLGVKEGFDIEPVSGESTNIISGTQGRVLFSLTQTVSSTSTSRLSHLVWFSVFFILLSLVIQLARKRSTLWFIIFLVGVTLVRLLCFVIEQNVSPSLMFSPKLYADTLILDSLGDLLLNNLYISLIVLGIYMYRGKLLATTTKWGSILIKLFLFVLAIALFFHINYTLRSLVRNSSIVMELHRITEINIYTIVCYVSYALLFIVFMFNLQLLCMAFKVRRRRYLFTIQNMLLYAVIVALYTLFTVSLLSIKKEAKWAALTSNKLAIERDLELEMDLRDFENKLSHDAIFENFLASPNQNLRQIEQRFSELYFQRIKQKYLISMTICSQNDAIQIGSRLENCLTYFANRMEQNNAVQIDDNSSFFYLSNNNGRIGYLGAFYYETPDGPVNMFIEIETKYNEAGLGYPSSLTDTRVANFTTANIPSYYSYAKYYNNKLVLSEGDFSYPQFASALENTKSIIRKDGYLHFINYVDDERLVVISRQRLSHFPYFVSFSYLVLFYVAIFYLIIRYRRLRQRTAVAFKKTRKKSIRNSLTLFITILMTVSLISCGIGSLVFCLNYYNRLSRNQMEEKIQIAQKTLSQFMEYLDQGDLSRTMDRLAGEIQSDINLWSPKGKLIRSTKQEIFSKYTLSSRMNSTAFCKIVKEKQSKLFNKERIGMLKYNSLYSAVYSQSGELLAVVNVPYFNRDSGLSDDVTQIVAAIINVVILLLLIALFFARVLSRRVTEPLVKISNKMKFMNVSDVPEHIEYKGENELGVLVQSYNQMVDSVSESTRRIAQSEREKAWSDMARQIAHEIKNPLTPMKLSIQRLIKLKSNNPEAFDQKFGAISDGLLEQIDILSNTASEFSSYAKFYVEEGSKFNLYALLKEQATMFDNRENIRISFTSDTENAVVFARRGQIIRVVVNLVTNAIQALEQSVEKGFIKISLAAEDDFYRVSVEDNGNGVSQENLSKLFSPNFTTKSSGNGLGLAISKSIIEQSGGAIGHKKSDLGGACFEFTLPKYSQKD